MPLNSNATGRPRRLVLGMTMTAAALLIAGCSSSSTSSTPPSSTAPAVATPTTSAPAAASAAADAGALSGTWSGQYSGAYQGTFILKWRQGGSNLSGTIKLSAPPSTLAIHGTVQGGAIQFGTVGSLGITYSGSVSGSSMSGNYQVNGGGGSSGGPWKASKS